MGCHNAHLLAVYGFSIIEIVKDNPKEETIRFGGIKGQASRSMYVEMTYLDTMDKAAPSAHSPFLAISVAGVLPISPLVNVVFYHGVTMQRAVELDSENRSNYAMYVCYVYCEHVQGFPVL